jgi:hypothetical protein
MNIFDILPDPRLVDLFRAILESGGVIYGGCIRDLIRYGSFQVTDVDVYYDSSLIKKSVVFNPEIVNNLTRHIKSKPSFNHIDHLHWIDSPVDDYNDRVDQFELGVPCRGYPEHHYLDEEVIVLDLMFRDGNFETLNSFLDFDVNSLYILPDGDISSSLGVAKVNAIISNIRSGKFRIMRSDVPACRINHILYKNYKCNLTLFL